MRHRDPHEVRSIADQPPERCVGEAERDLPSLVEDHGATGDERGA
jgi:hypothetical protein